MSECKFNVGDVWLTRDGRKQQIIAVTPVNPVTGEENSHPVFTAGEAGLVFYLMSGFVFGEDEPNSLDLIGPYVEPRAPREWWINLYDGRRIDHRVHTSKYGAVALQVCGLIECVHVREVLEE